MIVDDSLTVRTVFSRMVEGDGTLQVSGTASNAEQAIRMLRTMTVDVILLDLEMPGMGGLQALPGILETGGEAQVLVVSSLTVDGAEHTLAALSMGAADTMLKPQPGGFDDEYRNILLTKIKALGGVDGAAIAKPVQSRPHLIGKRAQVIAIGASTGGIHALNIMLRAIPKEFDLPILVTQHLPASFMPVFARQLEMASARQTHVAGQGTVVRNGEILIASGDGHMVFARHGDELITKVSKVPAPSGCLPSVDPMFESLADVCKGHVLGVVLSGMGSDGLIGSRYLIERGGTVLAQDAETSAVWGMPGSVAKANLASAILPPEGLAEKIAMYAGVPACN
jgi:two-component system chemotaxis response regulator CheB